MAYQRAYFPMKNINVSQGYGMNSSTHKLSYALDLSGKDNGKDNIYAPFDCIVSKLYQPKDATKHANTVWLTSTKKVLSPNGYYGYLTISITHPDEIAKMKIGNKYKQGQIICTEGKTGNASGNHIHLEVSLGTSASWKLENMGNYSEYVILNKVKPEEYLFLENDTNILSDTYKNNKYNFIKEEDLTYIVEDVPSEPLNIHNKDDYSSDSVIKGKGLHNGDEVIVFYDVGTMSYIYHYEVMGFVSNKYLKKK